MISYLVGKPATPILVHLSSSNFELLLNVAGLRDSSALIVDGKVHEYLISQ
jgi:hypothetical protein